MFALFCDHPFSVSELDPPNVGKQFIAVIELPFFFLSLHFNLSAFCAS